MALDLSKISAGLYEGVRKTFKRFPKEEFDKLTNSFLDGWEIEYYFLPANPIQLQLYSIGKSMLAGVDEVFGVISQAPECVGKNADKLRRALNVLLTNLLIWHFSCPSYYSRVSHNKNNYKLIKRYNPFEIGYRSTVAAISGLKHCGFIQFEEGGWDRNTKEGWQTRIRPTAKLTELLIGNYSISPATFNDIDQGETIILKDDRKVSIPYKDTDETNRMRKVLTAYNKLLRESTITLPSTDPEVERVKHKRQLNLAASRYHRPFNNSSFKLGGRFYGPWWQAVPGDLRKHLKINGNPTVELDYSAIHIHILYGYEGQDYYKLFPKNDDPYQLPSFGDYERKALKYGILIALNVANEAEGIGVIREKLKGEGLYKNGMRIKGILNKFCDKHPLISHYLYSQIGKETQYTDSCVAEYVIKRLTAKGITCLCIHDSFIVEKKHRELLEGLMIKGFKANGLKSIPLIKLS
jgi:hypothetical protein